MHWGSPRLEGAALSFSTPQAPEQKIKLFVSYRALFMPLFYLGGNQGTDWIREEAGCDSSLCCGFWLSPAPPLGSLSHP